MIRHILSFFVALAFSACTRDVPPSTAPPSLSSALLGGFCADEGSLRNRGEVDSRSCVSVRFDDDSFKVKFNIPKTDYPWSVQLSPTRGEYGELIPEDLSVIEAANLALLESLGIPASEVTLVTRHKMADMYDDEGPATRVALSVKTFVEHSLERRTVFGDRFAITRDLDGAVIKLIARWHADLQIESSASIDNSLAAAETDAETAGQERNPELVEGWFPVDGFAKKAVALKLRGLTTRGTIGTGIREYYVDGQRLARSTQE